MYSVYSPRPFDTITFGQFHLRLHFFARVFHRTGEVAALDGKLHADVTRVAFAIDERRAVRDLNVGEFFQRNLRAIGGRYKNIPDLFRRAAVTFVQTNHEVELLLALHHLRRRRAADRRLNQAVHIQRRSP